MSQFFSFSRFGRLVRQQLQAEAGGYLLQAVGLLGIMLLVIGLLSYLQGSPPSQGGQQVLLLLFVLGAGAYFASTMLAKYGQGSRAAMALLLPASQAEKFALAWLLSGPLLLAVVLADFYLADWLVLTLSRPPGTLYNVLADAASAQDILRGFALVHGLALWGSIYFRRQQLVRTAVLVLVAAVVLSVLNFRWLKGTISPGIAFALPFGTPHLPGPEADLQLRLPDAQTAWLGWLPLALTLLLWAAAYARLTEKQL